MAADLHGLGVALATGAPAREDYRRRSRRTWSADEKLAIVAEADASGEPVAAVARRHGMNANHLHQWLSRAREGRLCGRRGRPPRTLETTAGEIGFIALGMVGEGAAQPSRVPMAGGCMEIELASGARVRVWADVDGEALRRVLAAARAAL
jgi:transposase